MAFKKRALETLSYTSGNIIDDKAEVLVNTVNAQLSPSGRGVMGKGVALAFKETFPSIMKDYENAIKSGELKAGRALLFDLPDGRKWAALATKDDWRDKSQIEWVESGLKELGEKLREGGFKSVAITPPGCGNGGLDWKQVEPMVHEHLEGVAVSMYAKPSGAMVQAEASREASAGPDLAALAIARDGRIKKPLYGKVVGEPNISFDQTHGVSGHKRVFMSLAIKEPTGTKSIPVDFQSDVMDDKAAHSVSTQLAGLKDGDEVSLGGGWKGSTGAWYFKAERIAEGRVHLSGLMSTSPSPALLGDPYVLERAKAASSKESAPMKSASPSVVDENTPVKLSASMYFAYSGESRPEIKSRSTFDAILDGERTSTTRYDKWHGSDKWGKLEKGDLVRFYDDREMKGRSVVVRIDSVERVDMSKMTDADREAWSKAEGWSVEHARKSGQQFSGGFQVRYRPEPGQAILEGRGAEHLANRMETAAQSVAKEPEVARPRPSGMLGALSMGMER